MKVITYIYQPFDDASSSSHQFLRSCNAFGYDIVNSAKKNYHVGNGEVLRLLYNTYRELDEPVCYADGGDSFFLRPINIPTEKILYSTEKNIWPPVQSLQNRWATHEKKTHWCYLNGGGYCGPAKLIAEFFDRYGLNTHDAGVNGQWEQSEAYFLAIADGFPIELDQLCSEFQTIGFWAGNDFTINPGMLRNNLTGSMPALIHGNGRTPMGWVYEIMPEQILPDA